MIRYDTIYRYRIDISIFSIYRSITRRSLSSRRTFARPSGGHVTSSRQNSSFLRHRSSGFPLQWRHDHLVPNFRFVPSVPNKHFQYYYYYYYNVTFHSKIIRTSRVNNRSWVLRTFVHNFLSNLIPNDSQHDCAKTLYWSRHWKEVPRDRLVDVAQWKKVGLWPANFPWPALYLQLIGNHLYG